MKSLEKRPQFNTMDENQCNEYILMYIKTRFPKTGPLIGKLPVSERDDAIQEIYIDLWENRFSYDPTKADFSTYAFNRGRGVVKDLMTKKNKTIRVASKIFEERRDPYYHDENAEEIIELIDSVLNKIKPEHANILRMRFIEEMSIEQIAGCIGCSKQKIYQIISKACSECKRCITR